VRVIVLTLLLLASLIAGPSAQAEEPVALVSIRLTAIDPALPTRDGTITLAGTVKNITKQPLIRLRALFWRDQALASASNDPIGARLYDRKFQDLYTAARPDLAPGASVKFTLTVAVSDLELPRTDGVYLMGVHVLQNGVDPNVAIGRGRVFVPILDKAPKESIRLTSIVELASRPSLVRKGVLADDHLAGEIEPGGRLDELMKAADSDQTSFAVDPALIDELETMESGYQVLGASDTTTAGTGQDDAARWLDAFAALKTRRDGFRLPFGNPDLAALVHDGQRAPIRASTAAGKLVSAASSLPLLVIPAGGAADSVTLGAANRLGPAAVVLADAAVPDGRGPLLEGIDKAETPIVRYTSSALGGGPGPAPFDTPVQIQQRMLADTWVEASTASGDAAHGRVRLIIDAAQAKGDGTSGKSANIDAPWLKPSTLSDLLDRRPIRWDHKLRYSTPLRDAELDPAQVSSIKRFNAAYGTYADLLVDGSAARTARNAAVARAASAAWRGEPAARASFLSPQQVALDTILTTSVVISSTRLVSTAGRQVEFPITIKNDLPVDEAAPEANAVKVQLVFSSDNSQRLSIATIDAPQILPHGNLSKNAKVTAKANGIVPVRAQLFTDSGKPIGRPVTISVRVTQNGTVGWVIALAAGLVLAGSTALRIRQVGRERAKVAAGDDVSPPSPSALTSATPTDGSAAQGGPGARDV
jgi:hypothetical protein